MKLSELKEGQYYVIEAEGKRLKRAYKYNGVDTMRKGDHYFVNSNGLLRVAAKRMQETFINLLTPVSATHWYQWGDEPRGHVTTYCWIGDDKHTIEVIPYEQAKAAGLQFECPHA